MKLLRDQIHHHKSEIKRLMRELAATYPPGTMVSTKWQSHLKVVRAFKSGRLEVQGDYLFTLNPMNIVP